MGETKPTVAEMMRPELAELGVYALDQVPCRHKLDQNEVPWDLPARLKRRVTEALLGRDWSRYPDFHAEEVRRALGDHYGWSPDGVLVGNGSNELIGVALEAFVRRRPDGGPSEVLGHVPSFGLYPMLILRAGGTPRLLGPTADLTLPLDGLLEEVSRDPTRPLLLCTPNNPTGDAAPVEVVEELLERLEAPLLLDNAYGEFSERDYLPLLERHPHLIVFRTFSKAWSLGGMRLGYLLAAPEMVAELAKVKLPYNIGHAGAIAARVAVEEAGAARRRTRAILGRREQWRRMLEAAGLEVFPSEASFLLVRAGSVEEARRVRDGLGERGILVRDMGGYPGLAGCLRVSVGHGRALADTRRALSELGLPGPGDGTGGTGSEQGAKETRR